MALFFSCGEPEKPEPVVIVPVPEELEPAIVKQIDAMLDYALGNEGIVEDSLKLLFINEISSFYEWSGKKRIWGSDKQWLPRADSMLKMLGRAAYYGLYPEDYHYEYIHSIVNKLKDSANQKDAALWSRGDILFSNAFIHMAHDLHIGRMGADSTTLKKNWVLNDSFYHSVYNLLVQDTAPEKILESLEPEVADYDSLKRSLSTFLSKKIPDSFTYVGYPVKDTSLFFKQLQKRLMEDSLWSTMEEEPDSVALSKAIKVYQKKKGLIPDGKIGSSLFRSMNHFRKVLLARVALNLDRYKHLPDTMPSAYVWINLPSFQMEAVDSGRVVLRSRIIIGKPNTRTPVLQSEIMNFITYPQWTVPYSIVFKEMLPKIQKDITWLKEQNLMIVNYKDEVIDPASINWSTVSKKNFRYMIRQKQGDDNSLGVIKFNFKNKYDVYMHDTDARSLFDSPERAFSHGCMRIQQWDSLARFVLWKQQNPRQGIDSLKAWISRKEKHLYSLGNRIPVYVRYFTIKHDAQQEIQFFEDIYGEDNEFLMGSFNKYLH